MDRVEHARHRVKQFRGRFPEIAKSVGVSTKWVNNFSQGILKEPGVRKFEKLEKWLKANDVNLPTG